MEVLNNVVTGFIGLGTYYPWDIEIWEQHHAPKRVDNKKVNTSKKKKPTLTKLKQWECSFFFLIPNQALSHTVQGNQSDKAIGQESEAGLTFYSRCDKGWSD